MKVFISMVICSVVFLSTARAETMYVSDILRITLRTGPGVDHKIIKMLTSGNKVEVVESGEEWSKVQLPDGKEGWVLSRFITPEKSSRLLLAQFEKKQKKLKAQLIRLQEQNAKLIVEKQRLSKELGSSRNLLEQTAEAYEGLKTESTDFLKLKADHEKSFSKLSEQTIKAESLEKQLRERNIYLMLLGVGILFAGFVVGIKTKRKRYSSTLT